MADLLTAPSRWEELANRRAGLVHRCERYAELTIPSTCPPDGYHTGSDELTNPLHSVGPMAVNSLINSMVLAMFAPSRPFMKLTLPKDQEKAICDSMDWEPTKLAEQLSVMEHQTTTRLDELGVRPKLFDLFAHLIVTGNCLRLTEGDSFRILGIKDFVSARNSQGEVIEIMTREMVRREELPPELQEECASEPKDRSIGYFRWWKWDPKRQLFLEEQWLNGVKVTTRGFSGQYTREDMPAQHHTWRLPDKSDYGIGQVEDYRGDLEGLESLTEAEVNGGVLASEFRWLVNPGGMTRPEDIAASRNGDAIPGTEGDLTIVNAAGQVAGALQVVSNSAEKYVRRISQGFLMPQSVQRDAERVTAEEIRVLARQLETGLGGIYSRLAVDLQLPLARWLMKNVNISDIFKGTDFKPTIVTGLDALSRNGDLEAMQALLADVVQITSMPPQVLSYLRLDAIISNLAAGRGLMASDFIRTQEEVDQQAQAQQQQMAAQEQQQYAAQKSIDQQTGS